MLELFDSHCHLDFDRFDDDRDEVVERARDVGVRGWFVPGVRPAQWSKLPALSERYSDVAFGVGVHPWYVSDVASRQKHEWRAELEAALTDSSAVGECGLDALHAKRGGTSLEVQQRVFEVHLQIAKERALPLVVHVVHAHGAALDLLRRYGPFTAGGVIHSYSGNAELLARYSDLGFYFGVSAAVLSPRALKLRQAVQRMPAERLLLETDAPDQAPGGKTARNESLNLPAIAAEVASLRQASIEQIARQSSINARRLFGLDATGAG